MFWQWLSTTLQLLISSSSIGSITTSSPKMCGIGHTKNKRILLLCKVLPLNLPGHSCHSYIEWSSLLVHSQNQYALISKHIKPSLVLLCSREPWNEANVQTPHWYHSVSPAFMLPCAQSLWKCVWLLLHFPRPHCWLGFELSLHIANHILHHALQPCAAPSYYVIAFQGRITASCRRTWQSL